MKPDRQAQQLVEYLLLFTVVVVTVFGVSRGIGEKVSGVLDSTLDGLADPIYTYGWEKSHCLSCSLDCVDTINNPGVIGKQTCYYHCERNDGVAAPGYCEGTAPQTSSDCNIHPCSINCKLADDWDPGTCYPECGTNRTRIDTKKVVTPAQYGGAECTEASSRVLTGPPWCPDVPCPGVCGDGVFEVGEICEGTNLGDYSGLSCEDQAVKDLARMNFIGGSISCNEFCAIDMSQCEYVGPCGEWGFVGECGEDGCAENERLQVRDCPVLKYGDGSPAGRSIQQTQCAFDNSCEFICAQINTAGSPSPCPGSDQGLTQDGQAWVYYDFGNCPGQTSAACTAECPDYGGFGAASSGCQCLNNNEPNLCDDNNCHECCIDQHCQTGYTCENYVCVNKKECRYDSNNYVRVNSGVGRGCYDAFFRIVWDGAIIVSRCSNSIYKNYFTRKIPYEYNGYKFTYGSYKGEGSRISNCCGLKYRPDQYEVCRE